MTGSSGITEEITVDESTFDPGHATRVHYATDPRIRALAQARWRMQTGGNYQEWLALGKDNPDALITEAREWVRAAVAGGVMPPPEPSDPAPAGVPAGLPLPFAALCSFCGKTNKDVAIVQGPGVAICGECIELVTLVHEETVSRPAPPERPAWLGECAKCVRLLGDLDRAAAGGTENALMEWETARIHLIEDHPERVTAFDPECANCLEWQARGQSPDPAPIVQTILERESLLHRAGHLIG
jgi:hypothetical protein